MEDISSKKSTYHALSCSLYLNTAHHKKSPTQLDTDLLLHEPQVAVKYSSGGRSTYSPAHNVSLANKWRVAHLNPGQGNIIMITAVIC